VIYISTETYNEQYKNIPFIIAEVGINHNGSMDIAKKLIDMAKNAGANAVKFQKRNIDAVYTKEFLDSPRESQWGTTQRDQKEGLEFGKKQYDEIDKYCKKIGIDWFASAWDSESQYFLRNYKLKYNKIASTMLTNIHFLEMVAEEKKHTFISTAMSTYKEIDAAVDIFKEQHCPYTIMHCVATYPCEDNECNILMVKTLKDRYKCDVGYSGHERGLLPSTLAVVYGARVLERHITLDRTMYGSDQAASVEKRGLEYLVRDTHEVFAMLGDGVKTFSDKEKQIAKKLRYFETQKIAKEV
jgi:N-acetylneuraminate synthase